MKYFIELIHVMQKTKTKSLKIEMRYIRLKKKNFHVEKSTYGLERVNIVYNWGIKWRLQVNVLKTNIKHVRPAKHKILTFQFKLGDQIINYCSK